MNKYLNQILNKSLLIYIYINLLYILIGSYMAFNSYIRERIFSYGFIVLLVINIIIILGLFLKKVYKKNKIDIFLILIIIFAIISTIFAYKPQKALFGEFLRYEGLFTILYYITILFITSFIKKEDRKKVVLGILIFGLIQCIYGICQRLFLLNARTMIYKGSINTTGFTGNPNFFGALMIICACQSLGLFFYSKSRLNEVIFLILTYLFFIGILLSKTRSSLLSLMFILILLFIYSLKKKYIKKYIILCLVFVFVCVFLHLLHLSPVFEDIVTVSSEMSEVAKGNAKDNYGSNRIKLWKETIKIVPNYLLHGVGIDNFANVIDGNPIRYQGHMFDKAHNEYLQILVTMGIFSLISYLCLHFIIIKNGIINTFKNNEIYLILPVIGYLVQAQFNISVIEVAPIFYISLGLLVDR